MAVQRITWQYEGDDAPGTVVTSEHDVPSGVRPAVVVAVDRFGYAAAAELVTIRGAEYPGGDFVS